MVGNLPLAINLNKLADYRVEPDEAVFFEWLLFKQNLYGLNKMFFFSRKNIESSIGIKRRRLEAITKKFCELGFMETTTGTERHTNNICIYYYIDFEALVKKNLLSEIIKQDSSYYNELKKAIVDMLKKVPKNQP